MSEQESSNPLADALKRAEWFQYQRKIGHTLRREGEEDGRHMAVLADEIERRSNEVASLQRDVASLTAELAVLKSVRDLQRDSIIGLLAERDRLRAALVNLLSWLPPVDMDKNYCNDGRSNAIQQARKALAGAADETSARYKHDGSCQCPACDAEHNTRSYPGAPQ